MFLTLIAAILLLAWGATALAGDARSASRTAGAQPAGAQTPGGRNVEQITSEIRKVAQDLAPLFASPQDLFEPAKRQAAAPTAIPTLRKMIKLLDEVIAA